MEKNYNIGLDIGTSSVGWAVVEEGTQKVIKKGHNRKALWGVRQFDEAVTAEDRRQSRSNRRRYDRRRYRIKLLQKEFQEEINKVDTQFFQKLKESKYNEKDFTNKTIIISQNEKNLIKEYNQKYKTIYHLRNTLVKNIEKQDIRLVYLAIHHIIKYRGHFNNASSTFNVNDLNLEKKLKETFDLIAELCPNLNFIGEYSNLKEIATSIMLISKNDTKAYLKDLLKDFTDNKKFPIEFGKLIVGSSFNLKELLMLDIEKKELKMSFKDTDYDKKYSEIEEIISEKIEIVDALKQLYDLVYLKKLFKGKDNTNLSSLMVNRYFEHQNDLQILKDIVKHDKNLYKEILDSKHCLYEQYMHNKISSDEFCTKIQTCIEKNITSNLSLMKMYEKIKFRITNKEFLPKINSTDNGSFPYQLNKVELIKIIENQGKYYPFLLDKVNDDYKLVKLLEFKIPYYVGPLVSDTKSPFAWMERKIEKVKITPYNFDDVIDKDKTAEKFIERMISHCTYLLNEYVLPNNSILYSRYKVMNELKQIKVNGEKLSIELQHRIIDELFCQSASDITDKKFKEYLRTLNDFNMFATLNIIGYSSDNKFANDMKSYVDFFGKNGIFNGTTYTEEDADNIIRWVTIFEDKDILERKIRLNYPLLNNEQVKSILSKKYSGWGSLSKKLLTNLYYEDKRTNTFKSIMDLMYETNENFMQIINNDKYHFQSKIRKENALKDVKLNYSLVSELATSSANKRGIYQALKIVKEIVSYMGHEPKNIIIEMARSEEPKTRTIDRKKYLLSLYETHQEQIKNYNNLMKELNENQIDNQKLFLYFIQEGRCLYSGEKLNIEDLEQYEIDHILPQTLVKDNSIDNKALVIRKYNQDKGANLVLPLEYRNNTNKQWWAHLRSIGLISSKKFYNLIREKYSDDDIKGFINRQIVETRQITKHVANIINSFYKKTKVIYLKANLSHNYRECYELYKFRQINDYHHAHDAYLAAVLGEYKDKYLTKNIDYDIVKQINDRFRALKHYEKLKYGFVINSLDASANDIINDISKNFIDEKTGEILFDAKQFNQIVCRTLYRNDIIISRKTEIRSGMLYKETILPKDKGSIPIKKNMPVNLYGGYTNMETSYMVLVEYMNNKKIIGIPMEVALNCKNNISIKLEYLKKYLNLKNVNDFTILKDNISYDSLLIYRNHPVYIKGYSVLSGKSELSNAHQLRISASKLYEWRFLLNKILNNAYISQNVLSEDDLKQQAKDLLIYLFSKKSEFPLFINCIQNIEQKINIQDLSFEELSHIITQIFIIYHCNSSNGNLAEFGLGDRIGRLSGYNLNGGKFIFKSVTGIKEEEYEF